jgi:hypothetical protein
VNFENPEGLGSGRPNGRYNSGEFQQGCGYSRAPSNRYMSLFLVRTMVLSGPITGRFVRRQAFAVAEPDPGFARTMKQAPISSMSQGAVKWRCG